MVRKVASTAKTRHPRILRNFNVPRHIVNYARLENTNLTSRQLRAQTALLEPSPTCLELRRAQIVRLGGTASSRARFRAAAQPRAQQDVLSLLPVLRRAPTAPSPALPSSPAPPTSSCRSLTVTLPFSPRRRLSPAASSFLRSVSLTLLEG